VSSQQKTILQSSATVKVKFALKQAMKAQRRSRGIALLIFNLGAGCGWVVNIKLRPIYPRKRDPVPIIYEAGWAPEPVWAGVKNPAYTGIRFLDRPARIKSITD
jgi:hypothetical protein